MSFLSKVKVIASISDSQLKDIVDVEMDGIDSKDYPDFADAFIQSAAWKNGTALTEEELEDLNENSDFVHEHALDQMI